LAEEKLVCEARIKALRLEKGRLPETEDFTDKKAFDSLEKEFEAFHRFYQKQWSKTKKKIRKDILNYENLKGQNGQNHQP
ncbi:MAG: hypothetical protein IKM52_01115, partial [Clostridia bacterium]|nr:hypothetical protein [Clostridia bacterium]